MIVRIKCTQDFRDDKYKGVPLLFAGEIEAKRRYKVPEIRKEKGANTFAKGQEKRNVELTSLKLKCGPPVNDSYQHGTFLELV
jgi:hypothetical protein